MDYKEYQSGQTTSNFWFKAKNKLVDILLSKVYKNKKNLKILNLGTGTGDDLVILNKYGNIYAIDVNKDVLNLIQENLVVEKKVTNACKLPYENDFFDIVVSFDVLEHILEDNKAVSEVHRVLKKGGYLVFMVPAFQFLFSSHDKALDHKRRYNKKMLKNLLFKFNNLKLNYWNFAMFLPISCMRLMKKKSKPKIDCIKLPRFVDGFLYLLLQMENKCIKYNTPLPFGISIVGFCRK